MKKVREWLLPAGGLASGAILMIAVIKESPFFAGVVVGANLGFVLYAILVVGGRADER